MKHERILNNSLKLSSSTPYSFTILSIDDENKTICVIEIMSPKRTQFFLTSYIPYGKYYIFVLDFFNVEANGWYRSKYLSYVKLIQNRSFSCSVKAKHNYSHFTIAK
uniref:Uncharacterized protein n=1 Tax=Polytomella parva TaxID=51329 RepID=A0A7S0V1S7_9CHLO